MNTRSCRTLRGGLWLRGSMIAVLLLASLAANDLAAAQPARPIGLEVDARDVTRRIYQVRETLPARPGKLALHFAQWLPGAHAPRGPIDQMGGLRFTANGSELAWRRDPLDVYRFEVQVPAGVTEVVAQFQLLTAQSPEQGRIVMTPTMLNLQWAQLMLYPAGSVTMNVPVKASILLPQGWKQASALPVLAVNADRVDFDVVPFEILQDSPVFAGRYSAVHELMPGATPAVRLNLFADDPASLAATPEQIQLHRQLVREMYAALGPPHYDHYDVLLALSDTLSGIGLEHHRSSENAQPPGYFTSWDENVGGRDLLPHEMTHSWNGKYRRPARLWTPNFNTPMQDDLLWVYEGLTQYYGTVFAARSGLWSLDFAREDLAATVATFDRRRPGRNWRPLVDTTYQPIITARRPLSWVSWQRTEDYYTEAVPLWLDVDTKLRELTGGARSLDDFSRAFFAAPATHGWVSTYERADVLRELARVAPFDWQGFFAARVDATHAPLLDGIERAGYRLVYNDQPNAAVRDLEKARKATDLAYSLGVVVSGAGVLTDVVWDSPAFKAGLTTNTTLVAVNGRAYTAELLKQAITEAAKGGPAIELILRNQDRFRTVQIDYRGGLQYPHLERVEGRPDGLAALFGARTAAP
ncbi:MAG: hypothetical protein QM696_01280 [Steroidobacteraceae bacterium]